MDYTEYISLNMFDIYEEMYTNILNEMNYQLNICDLSKYIITEANILVNFKNELKEIVKRVKEFFTRIFGKFKENTDRFFTSNQIEKVKKMGKINVDEKIAKNVRIKLIPYWLMPDSKIKSTIDSILSNIKSICNKNIPFKDMIDEIRKTILGEYSDDNSNFKEGVKNYFRAGKSTTIDKVELTGSELVRRMTEFFDYIIACTKNYGVSPEHSSILSSFKNNDITVFENIITRKMNNAATESFINDEILSIIMENDEKTDTTVEIEKDENRNQNQQNQNKGQNNNQNTNSSYKTTRDETAAKSLLKLISMIIEVLYSSYLTIYNEKVKTYSKVVTADIK